MQSRAQKGAMDYLSQSATSRRVTIVLAYQCSLDQSEKALFHKHHETKNIKADAGCDSAPVFLGLS